MKCLAIKENLVCCKGNSMKYGDYCSFHDNDDYKQCHKDRWWRKYILGKSTGVFLLARGGRKGENRMHEDLSSGRITITPEDIAKIPALDRYIDIFAWLCEHGWAISKQNEPLWRKGMLYVITKNMMYHNPRNEVYLTSVNETQNSLLLNCPGQFSDVIDLIAYKVSSLAVLHPIHLMNLTNWMNTLLNLDVVKKISWMNKGDFFYAIFSAVLGTEHALTTYMTSRFLPEIRSILKTEMGIQKAKMLHYKEEIVAKAWHPRRLELYLNMGYSLDDILEEEVDTTLHTKCILQEKSTLYKHISLGDV